jgi:uncharacterized protein YjbI with pentapeptide repeats
MTRDEALKLLMGGEYGVTKWNRLRNQDEPIPSLSGAKLNRLDLAGVDLECVDLKAADLSDSYLHQANFGNAQLHRAQLVGIISAGNKLTCAMMP